MAPNSDSLDVLIIGAGLSGIGAAAQLRRHCPELGFAILEAREAIGGTWDLFRFPGVRSDSDMYTLGYGFRPWTGTKAIADGRDILAYIRETARAEGVEPHIRFRHRVVRADWSSTQSRWTVDIERDAGGPTRLQCGFLYFCTGYYDDAAGYQPVFAGRETFRGDWVHPQHWPPGLDWSGRRVAIIGSGATAITLAPAMAAAAAGVTVVQRSPSDVLALPSRDLLANGLRRILPVRIAHAITRWKNALIANGFFWWSRRQPRLVRRLLLAAARRALGPGHDLRHFRPHYRPWAQRMCFLPDGDLFDAIRNRRVEMVTDTIDRITPDGLRLTSGREVPADLIVSATGLQLLALGGAVVTVDGQEMSPPDRRVYKGMMLSDVPNFAFATGYVNASWTLKCELSSRHLCRLLRHMRSRGHGWCVPRAPEDVGDEPLIDFSSGYIRRGAALLPRQGRRRPWKLFQNYFLDMLMLRFGRVDDPALEFGPAPSEITGTSGE